RKNGSGRKFISEGVDGSDDAERSSPSHVKNGVSFDGKFGNKGSARRILSKDVDADRSNESGDIRSRRKESGRRFISKDINGSNAMYAG
ncbi:keratin type I cytoskeletal 9-like, partial [Trifolium medium]|nr:keratin type I cytoskeletal 9-like [Trifolium medium]